MEELEEIEVEEEIEHFDDDNVKPKKKGKFLNIVSNIIFVPVLVILIIYLVYAISVHKSNGIPSFFGQSYVRVLSGSMRKSGFQRGDVVVIKRVNISSIKAADEKEKNGTIIAFYYKTLMANSDASKAQLSTVKNATTKNFKTGKKTDKTAIMFHQVIGIYYDNAGNTWFETKGTSNASADAVLVRGDYIIGAYVDSGMADVIEFLSSSKGMIVLIIVPSSILLFMLLLNIIEIIDQMMREKKERGAIISDVKERELEVTTIIEDEEEFAKTKKHRRRKAQESDDIDD